MFASVVEGITESLLHYKALAAVTDELKQGLNCTASCKET
jgi:hypothetical protein